MKILNPWEEEIEIKKKMARRYGAWKFEIYTDRYHRDYLTVFYLPKGVIVYFDSTGREEEYPVLPHWIKDWILYRTYIKRRR